MNGEKDHKNNRLYTAWAIASKDILEVLKNKNTLINILIMFALVVFFYWMSTVRPFDKRIEAVVYDQGSSQLSLDNVNLSDGYTMNFYPASSPTEMERMMRYERMGLILPVDFDQKLAAGGGIELDGYILWHHRTKVTELEAKYSDKFSELLDQPIRITIEKNFVKPPYDIQATMAHFTILYIILFAGIALVPHLMLEEKQNKTLDASWVKPLPGCSISPY